MYLLNIQLNKLLKKTELVSVSGFFSLSGEKGVLFYTLASGSTEPNYDELCLDWYEDEMEKTPTPYYGERLGYSTPRYLQRVDSWSWLGRSCPCDVRTARVSYYLHGSFCLILQDMVVVVKRGVLCH